MKVQSINYQAPEVLLEPSALCTKPIQSAEQDLKRMVSGEHHSERIRIGHLQTLLGSQLLGFEGSKGGVYPVKIALSCLIQPQAGDLVQILQTHAQCWVLSVLERETPQQALQLDFGIHAVNINAQQMTFNVAGQLQFSAEEIKAEANVLIQNAADRQSHITGTDSTYAGSVVLKAERHLGIHAGMANLKAKSLLKIDAAQIHMG
jgi:hypothetical protein